MFQINKLPEIKNAKIEGGGNVPEIQYNDNDIAFVDPQEVFQAVQTFRTGPIKDLNNRTIVPFMKNNKDSLIDLLTVWGVESASNIDRSGNETNMNNVYYNPNAQYQSSDGESYGLFQIDVSDENFVYPLMAMNPEYRSELTRLAQTSASVRNKRAKEIYNTEGVREEVIEFLKDPNNIYEHLLIAATIFQDKGMNGWNAWKNRKKSDVDKGFAELYDTLKSSVNDTVFKTWTEELLENNAKNEADMLEILEIADKMPANINERAKQLISAYEEFDKQSGNEMESHVQKKINMIKPFTGNYGK